MLYDSRSLLPLLDVCLFSFVRPSIRPFLPTSRKSKAPSSIKPNVDGFERKLASYYLPSWVEMGQSYPEEEEKEEEKGRVMREATYNKARDTTWLAS